MRRRVFRVQQSESASYRSLAAKNQRPAAKTINLKSAARR